ETTTSALGFVERCDFRNLRPYDWCDHQLGYARAARDCHRCVTEIGEQDLDFAAVVGIDRAGRVENSKAVTRGEPRPGPHLRFIAIGQGDRDAGWHKTAFARGKGHRVSG